MPQDACSHYATIKANFLTTYCILAVKKYIFSSKILQFMGANSFRWFCSFICDKLEAFHIKKEKIGLYGTSSLEHCWLVVYWQDRHCCQVFIYVCHFRIPLLFLIGLTVLWYFFYFFWQLIYSPSGSSSGSFLWHESITKNNNYFLWF